MDRKRLLIDIAVLAGILGLIAISFLAPRPDARPGDKPSVQKTTSLKIDDHQFNARLAITDTERTVGLSGSKLIENEAMLFAFPRESKWGIWMKDMLIPLDIIWLDTTKSIVHIEEKIEPDTYPTTFRPHTDSLYVIELPSGTIKHKGITTNSKVAFNL